MIIYEGDFLRISYEVDNELMLFYWINPKITFSDYKIEMCKYVELFQKYKPKYMLWIQENFDLKLTDEICMWIESSISSKINEIGIEKTAFVIGRNIEHYTGFINFLKKEKLTGIYKNPKHFSTKEEARNWLLNNTSNDISSHEEQSHKIFFEGVDSNGNPTFKFKTKSRNISNTVEFLNKYIEQQETVEKYRTKFENLTERELEILRLFTNNKKITAIANELFISVHTARTHWKNIKRKLEVRSNMEIVRISEIYFEMTDNV